MSNPVLDFVDKGNTLIQSEAFSSASVPEGQEAIRSLVDRHIEGNNITDVPTIDLIRKHGEKLNSYNKGIKREPRKQISINDFQQAGVSVPVLDDYKNRDEYLGAIRQFQNEAKNAPFDYLNREDLQFQAFQEGLSMERKVRGEETGPLVDKGYRVIEGFAGGLMRSVGLSEQADVWGARLLPENTDFNETFMSKFAQGAGDFGASIAIFTTASALSGGNVGVGMTASMAAHGTRRYQDAFNRVYADTNNEHMANEAGFNAMPGAVVEGLADYVVAGRIFKGSTKEFAKGFAKAENKGKYFASVLADSSKRKAFVEGALSEGFGSVAGDTVAGLGMVEATGNPEYTPTGKELVESFIIEGLLGGAVGGAFQGAANRNNLTRLLRDNKEKIRELEKTGDFESIGTLIQGKRFEKILEQYEKVLGETLSQAEQLTITQKEGEQDGTTQESRPTGQGEDQTDSTEAPTGAEAVPDGTEGGGEAAPESGEQDAGDAEAGVGTTQQGVNQDGKELSFKPETFPVFADLKSLQESRSKLGDLERARRELDQGSGRSNASKKGANTRARNKAIKESQELNDKINESMPFRKAYHEAIDSFEGENVTQEQKEAFKAILDLWSMQHTSNTGDTLDSFYKRFGKFKEMPPRARGRKTQLKGQERININPDDEGLNKFYKEFQQRIQQRAEEIQAASPADYSVGDTIYSPAGRPMKFLGPATKSRDGRNRILVEYEDNNGDTVKSSFFADSVLIEAPTREQGLVNIINERIAPKETRSTSGNKVLVSKDPNNAEDRLEMESSASTFARGMGYSQQEINDAIQAKRLIDGFEGEGQKFESRININPETEWNLQKDGDKYIYSGPALGSNYRITAVPDDGRMAIHFSTIDTKGRIDKSLTGSGAFKTFNALRPKFEELLGKIKKENKGNPIRIAASDTKRLNAFRSILERWGYELTDDKNLFYIPERININPQDLTFRKIKKAEVRSEAFRRGDTGSRGQGRAVWGAYDVNDNLVARIINTGGPRAWSVVAPDVGRVLRGGLKTKNDAFEAVKKIVGEQININPESLADPNVVADMVNSILAPVITTKVSADSSFVKTIVDNFNKGGIVSVVNGLNAIRNNTLTEGILDEFGVKDAALLPNRIDLLSNELRQLLPQTLESRRTGMNIRRALDVLFGQEFYEGDYVDVVARELVQNSVDAVNRSENGQQKYVSVSTVFDREARESGDEDVEFGAMNVGFDNGSGMLPDVVINKFLPAFETGKELDEMSSDEFKSYAGGKGLAKITLLGDSNGFIITTRAYSDKENGKILETVIEGDGEGWKDFVESEFEDTLPVGETNIGGLKITVRELDAAVLEQEAEGLRSVDQAFLTGTAYVSKFTAGSSEKKRSVYMDRPTIVADPNEFMYDAAHVTYDEDLNYVSETLIDRFRSSYRGTNQVKDSTGFEQKHLDLRSADVSIYVDPNEKVSVKFGFDIDVLNNGIRQFDAGVEIKGVRKDIKINRMYINIDPKVDASDHDYPFNNSRDGIKGEVARNISNFVTRIAKAQETARIQELRETRKETTIKNNLGEDIPIFGISKELSQEDFDKISSIPGLKGFATFISELNDIVNPLSDIFGKFKFEGISIHPEAYGFRFGNVSKKSDGTIYFNPFVLVFGGEGVENRINNIDSDYYDSSGAKSELDHLYDLFIGVLVHEISHQLSHSEGEGHARAMTFSMGIIERMSPKIKEIFDENITIKDYNSIVDEGEEIFEKIHDSYDKETATLIEEEINKAFTEKPDEESIQIVSGARVKDATPRSSNDSSPNRAIRSGRTGREGGRETSEESRVETESGFFKSDEVDSGEQKYERFRESEANDQGFSGHEISDEGSGETAEYLYLDNPSNIQNPVTNETKQDLDSLFSQQPEGKLEGLASLETEGGREAPLPVVDEDLMRSVHGLIEISAKNGNIATFLHEGMHILRITGLMNEMLSSEELKGLEQAAGVKDGVWNVEAEEKLARSFEAWLRNPSTTLQPGQTIDQRISPLIINAFNKIKNWMQQLYANLRDSPLPSKKNKNGKPIPNVHPGFAKAFESLFNFQDIGQYNPEGPGQGAVDKSGKTGLPPDIKIMTDLEASGRIGENQFLPTTTAREITDDDRININPELLGRSLEVPTEDELAIEQIEADQQADQDEESPSSLEPTDPFETIEQEEEFLRRNITNVEEDLSSPENIQDAFDRHSEFLKEEGLQQFDKTVEKYEKTTRNSLEKNKARLKEIEDSKGSPNKLESRQQGLEDAVIADIKAPRFSVPEVIKMAKDINLQKMNEVAAEIKAEIDKGSSFFADSDIADGLYNVAANIVKDSGRSLRKDGLPENYFEEQFNNSLESRQPAREIKQDPEAEYIPTEADKVNSKNLRIISKKQFTPGTGKAIRTDVDTQIVRLLREIKKFQRGLHRNVDNSENFYRYLDNFILSRTIQKDEPVRLDEEGNEFAGDLIERFPAEYPDSSEAIGSIDALNDILEQAMSDWWSLQQDQVKEIEGITYEEALDLAAAMNDGFGGSLVDLIRSLVNESADTTERDDVDVKPSIYYGRAKNYQKFLQGILENVRKDLADPNRESDLSDLTQFMLPDEIAGRASRLQMHQLHFLEHLTSVDLDAISEQEDQAKAHKELFGYFQAMDALAGDGSWVGGSILIQQVADSLFEGFDFGDGFRDPLGFARRIKQAAARFSGNDTNLRRLSLIKKNVEFLRAMAAEMEMEFSMIDGHMEQLQGHLTFLRGKWFGKNKQSVNDLVRSGIISQIIQTYTDLNSTEKNAKVRENIKTIRESLQDRAKYGQHKKDSNAKLAMLDEVLEGVSLEDVTQQELIDHFAENFPNQWGYARDVSEYFEQYTDAYQFTTEFFQGSPFRRVDYYTPTEAIPNNPNDAGYKSISEEINGQRSSADLIGENVNNVWISHDNQMNPYEKQPRTSKAGTAKERGGLPKNWHYNLNLQGNAIRRGHMMMHDIFSVYGRKVLVQRLKNPTLMEAMGDDPGRVEFLEDIWKKTVDVKLREFEFISDLERSVRWFIRRMPRTMLSSVHHVVTQQVAAYGHHLWRNPDAGKYYLQAYHIESDVRRAERNDKLFRETNGKQGEKFPKDLSFWRQIIDARAKRHPEGDPWFQATERLGVDGSSLEKAFNNRLGDMLIRMDSAFEGLQFAPIKFGDMSPSRIMFISEILSREVKAGQRADEIDTAIISDATVASADAMVDENINVSRNSRRGYYLARPKGIIQLLTAFAGHRLNVATGVALRFRNLREGIATGNKEAALEAAHYISAAALQSVLFTGTKMAINAWIATQVAKALGTTFGLAIIGVDKEEEEEIEDVRKLLLDFQRNSGDSFTKSLTSDATQQAMIRDLAGNLVWVGAFAGADNWMLSVFDPFKKEMWKLDRDRKLEQLNADLRTAYKVRDANGVKAIKQDIEILENQKYIPLAFQSFGHLDVGGATGLTAESFTRFVGEASQAAVGNKEFDWTEWATSLSLLGYGQAEINKTLRLIEKSQNKIHERRQRKDEKVEKRTRTFTPKSSTKDFSSKFEFEFDK